MNTFDQIHDGFGRALYSLAEGWHQLRRCADQALTHFTPQRGSGGMETGPEPVGDRLPRWALLAAEVNEEQHQITVRVEVPGLEPDDFDIQVVGDCLVVRGEKRLQHERHRGRYQVMECAYGGFERALPLPAAVDEGGATASYRRGVLTVTLPKLESTPGNHITINVES